MWLPTNSSHIAGSFDISSHFQETTRYRQNHIFWFLLKIVLPTNSLHIVWFFLDFKTFPANYQIPEKSHPMNYFDHVATNQLIAQCWMFLYFQTFPANYQIPPESHTLISFEQPIAHCWFFLDLYIQTFPAIYQITPE